ncbi:hypothetical protein JCM11491_005531 [Sporobolomyces phaffii]
MVEGPHRPVAAASSQGWHGLDDDDPSLALVAALLMDDIRARSDAQLAQELQLDSLACTAEDEGPWSRNGHVAFGGPGDDDDDELVSMRHQVDLIQSTLSHSVIEALAVRDRDVVADRIRARQLDQLLDATARREQLDHEFARAVQREDDEGRDLDAAVKRGVEAAIGERRVRELMTVPPARYVDSVPVEEPSSNPSARDKGKSPVTEDAEDAMDCSTELVVDPTRTGPVCSICFESVRIASNPYLLSLKPSASRGLAFGMYVGPRGDGHVACIGCFGSYIENKLDDGTGKAFPMKCFEVACTYELNDDDAEHCLGLENLEVWHYRKLLDAIPALFCPNRNCSIRVERHEDNSNEGPRAQCPSCKTVMCTDCRTVWHESYSCEQYQALPIDERTPEDVAVFELARQQGYSRCPGCRALMELTEGCYHMTCVCGTESCFVCGSLWNRDPHERTGRCSKQPPCPLWSEERLLRPEYRDAALRAIDPLAPPPPAHGQQHPDALRLDEPEHFADHRRDRFRRRMEALAFLHGDRDSLNRFTIVMRRHNVCGYCRRGFRDSHALQQHLAALTHSLFICCGTMYACSQDLRRHLQNPYAHAPLRFPI